MARAALRIPVQAISTPIYREQYASIAEGVEIESEAWFRMQDGAATHSDAPASRERTYVDLRPRGALAYAL